jgi:hypothetical protein
MSHFTCVKTKIKERPYLIEALQVMGHDIEENKVLVVNSAVHAEEHPEFFAEVAIRNDIGFRWNKNTENYELVAELDTWDLDVPVSRFIDKVTQQYARMTLHGTVKEEGFEVAEEWEMDDNSIELTVTRWV